MEERPAISVDGEHVPALPACTDRSPDISELQRKMGANANNALSPPRIGARVIRSDLIVALKDDSASTARCGVHETLTPTSR